MMRPRTAVPLPFHSRADRERMTRQPEIEFFTSEKRGSPHYVDKSQGIRSAGWGPISQFDLATRRIGTLGMTDVQVLSRERQLGFEPKNKRLNANQAGAPHYNQEVANWLPGMDSNYDLIGPQKPPLVHRRTGPAAQSLSPG